MKKLLQWIFLTVLTISVVSDCATGQEVKVAERFDISGVVLDADSSKIRLAGGLATMAYARLQEKER